MKAYLVGGAIRDQLLELRVTERDWLVTGATISDMEALGFRAVGKDFPVFLHPKTQEEYALARTERKSGKGHKGFTFFTDTTISVEDDLFRRDLTINAIAQCPDTKALIDPFNGQADINAKWLRHVSSAFSEDPLRVLRVARFAARFEHLGFKIHPDTQQLIQSMVISGELSSLSPERVWQEMDKALSSTSAATFFEVLQGCGALEQISGVLAQLFNTGNKTQHSSAINNTPYYGNTAMRYAQLWHNANDCQLRDTATISANNTELKAPKNHRQLATAVALYQTTFHNLQKRTASDVLTLLSGLGGWRNLQLLSDFCSVCAVRGNPDNSDLLHRCYEAAASIDIQTLQNQGFKGKALGEAIDQQRLLLIAKTLTDAK